MTTPDRYRRLTEEFSRLVEMDEETRRTRLRTLREEDPALADELSQLLDNDDTEFSALDSAPAENLLADSLSLRMPDQLGPYRLGERLGEGGMGAVYAADHIGLDRPVAIKVLRHPLAGQRLRKRFLTEARLLALLDHPGIARIFDAGISIEHDDLPWIAMERVEGLRLDEYLERAAPPRKERIELLAKICDAVDHAHQRGVVHRDLKPGNILVSEAGEPTVLDFGIARAMTQDAEESLLTDSGQLLGTLPYMSPEQAAGDGARIGPPADVYALTVMLFEMQVGQRPLPLEDIVLTAALRTIQETPPPLMGQFDRSLRGDLETIARNGLEKDPAQRYATAAGLAAELRRHLRGEPIRSRPPSFLRQLKGFALRHKGAFAASVVILIALVAATTVSLNYAFRAEADRLHAESASRAATAEALKAQNELESSEDLLRFLRQTLGRSNPLTSGTKELTLREAIKEVAGGIEEMGAGEDIRSRLHGFVGNIYIGLGDYQTASEHLEAALAHLGDATPRFAWQLDILQLQAWQCFKRSDNQRALQAIEQARRGCEALGLLNELRGAELDITQGEVQLELQQFDAARTAVQAGLDKFHALYGEVHEEIAVAELVLGTIAAHQLDVESSKLHLERALTIRRELYGESHPLIAESLQSLASLAFSDGDTKGALKLLEQAIEIRERTLLPAHPARLAGLTSMAAIRVQLGQNQEALDVIEDLHPSLVEAYGPESVQAGMWFLRMADALMGMQRFELAAQRYHEGALVFRQHKEGSLREWTYCMSGYAECMLASDHWKESTKASEEIVKTLEARPREVNYIRSLNRIGLAALRVDEPAKAEKWFRRMTQEAPELGKPRSGHWIAIAHFHHGTALEALERPVEAIASYREVLKQGAGVTENHALMKVKAEERIAALTND